MFKDLEIMRTLRYLLIATLLSVASLVFATAQSLAQHPEVQMHSTSIIQGSGSSLPQAAIDGVRTTQDEYAGPRNGHIRKVEINPGGGDPDEPGDNSEPWEDPLGDVMCPLMMAIAVYALLRVYMRRKRE